MRSRQRYRHLVLSAIFSTLGAAGLQAQYVAAFETQLEQFAKKNLQEKIYVHTDREFYLAGDLAWFKLYLVDAAFHKPLDMSKVAYVEVLDQQNKPVVQAKIAMEHAEGAGSFFLPVTVPSGKYLFRAYTNWMKNAGPAFYFQKAITIINPQVSIPAIAQQVKLQEPDIQFFPEGGNLVAGIQGKVACKVTAPSGNGISVSGSVVDENNTTVTTFQALHAGIGSFVFLPQPGKHYKAIIETSAGQRFTRDIPAIYNEGTVMRLADPGTRMLQLHIESTNTGKIYLLAHTRQVVKLAREITLVDGKADITIEADKLGEGISHFTLFDGNRRPVCERLYFTYPRQLMLLSAIPGQQLYTPRQKIDLTLSAAIIDQPVNNASVSMAVVRMDSLETMPDDPIFSYLLLSSDLKGKIETPGWYFIQNIEDKRIPMDNLMLTHGWRRFDWDNVLQNRQPAFNFVPEYNGHIVTGRIIDTRNGKPAANINGYLSVPGNRTQFYPSVSDSKGQVRFEMKEMIGSSEVIPQTNSQQDSMYKLEIDNPFSTSHDAVVNLQPFSVPKSIAASLVSKSISTQVQNIYTGRQRKQFNLPALDSLPFYGKADATYYLDKYTRFITLEEVLREYVTYLDVQRSRGQFHIPLIDFTASQGLIPTKQVFYFPTDPLVLLDGVPLFDVTRLMAMDARKIRKLDIFNHRQFVRGVYFDGVLNWHTYNGDLADLELDPGAVAIDYEGLQPERIFYSPVYDTEDKRSSHLPDFRNLLYWAPSIHTDAKGMAKASFYSSDLKGKYAVILQGLNKSGVSGSGVAFFEIR